MLNQWLFLESKKLAVGSWQLAVGSWQLAVGSLFFVVSLQCQVKF